MIAETWIAPVIMPLSLVSLVTVRHLGTPIDVTVYVGLR